MSRSIMGLAGAIAFMACGHVPAFSSELEPWPPHDPDQPQAAVPMTRAWAAGLRDIRNFEDLQQAAGSRGKLLSIDEDAEMPPAVYGWDGLGGKGRMKAFLYRTGDFGISVTPVDDSGAVVMNNSGAFVCPSCSPPVDACGHRPSWVPHSVHWDGSDCHCTITGPQTLRPGPC